MSVFMERRVRKPTLPLQKINSSAPKPALLILNQPIPEIGLLDRLWQNSIFRICADGGANRLHDLFSVALENHRDDYVSHSLCSLSQERPTDVGAASKPYPRRS